MNRFLRPVLMNEEGEGEGGSAGDGSTEVTQLSSENWKDFVSEDLRGNSSLDKFTSLDGLAKSYLNAESMIGKDKIVIPTNEDEFGLAYDAMGRPENADSYDLKYPEGMDSKSDLSSGFRQMAYDTGMSQDQIGKIFNWYNEMNVSVAADQKTAHEAGMDESVGILKKEWGENYDANVEMASRVGQEFGDQEFMDFLADSGAGNNPAMIKFLHKIGELGGEDNLEGGSTGQTSTPDQIREEINGAMASTAYQNKADVGHDATVKKVQGLFERLHAAA